MPLYNPPVAVAMPSGSMTAYAGSTAPSGWLLCDGSAISRTTYAALFAVIGTSFGSGDGSSTFNVPDLRGRVPVGLDNLDNTEGTGGGDAGRLDVANTLGGSGGAQYHTLSTTEMPAHTHTQNSHTHGLRVDTGTGAASLTAGPGWLKANNVALGRLNSGTNDIVISAGGANGDVIGGTTPTNQNTGGDGAHNNMQPYLLVGYIIKT